MSQELLGNYSIQENLNTNFKLEFEIPDNCNYTTSTSSQVNYVTITLNEGEREPSPENAKYEIDYTTINDALTVQFVQQDLSETDKIVFIKRPRIIITT